MIKNGVLFQGIFLPCYRHTNSDLKKIFTAFKNSSNIYKNAIEKGVTKFLKGKEIKNVFRKKN